MAQDEQRVQIRKEACELYIQGGDDISRRVLSEKFGIPFSTMGYWSKEDNWGNRRRAYRLKELSNKKKEIAKVGRVQEKKLETGKIKKEDVDETILLFVNKFHAWLNDPDHKDRFEEFMKTAKARDWKDLMSFAARTLDGNAGVDHVHVIKADSPAQLRDSYAYRMGRQEERLAIMKILKEKQIEIPEITDAEFEVVQLEEIPVVGGEDEK